MLVWYQLILIPVDTGTGTFLKNWYQSRTDICYLSSVSNQPGTGIKLKTDFGLEYGRYMPCI